MLSTDRLAHFMDRSPSLAAVEKWTARRLGKLGHEHRVARIAASLLRVTSPRKLLDARHRRLLELGAIIHDVGRSVNDARHPQVGAKMIDNAPSLPLGKSDRRALCYLTRYHRGAVPRIGKDDYLQDCDDRKQLYTVLAYLRAADALDNRTLESPRLIFEMHRDRLQITAYLTEPCPKARRVYRRRRKFKLLEELLDLPIRVDVVCTDAMQMIDVR